MLRHRKRFRIASASVCRLLRIRQLFLQKQIKMCLCVRLDQVRRLLVHLVDLHIAAVHDKGADRQLIDRIADIRQRQRGILPRLNMF